NRINIEFKLHVDPHSRVAFSFFFQAEDGIRDFHVTGVQTCALPISLWVRPGLHIDPLLTGGTGGDSLDPEMPAALPDRIEAGTLNAPGIVGLHAGLQWLRDERINTVHAR